jgi:hypothetical protein
MLSPENRSRRGGITEQEDLRSKSNHLLSESTGRVLKQGKTAHAVAAERLKQTEYRYTHTYASIQSLVENERNFKATQYENARE